MSLDSAALGLALRTRKNLRSNAQRKPVTLLVMGQSTEQGPIPLSDRPAWPNAFTSQRNPGFMQKRLIAQPNRGGWWAKVHDAMWDWGYDLDIINGAVGGASLLSHIIGTVAARQNNTPYYKRRSAANYPDLGDFGELVQTMDGKVFNVTAGRNRQAFNTPPFAGVVGTTAYQDFVAFGQTAEATGATAPDTSSVAVGSSVADGAVTLTRVDAASVVVENTFYPGIDPAVNGGLPNINFGGALGERAAGAGFDPLGIIAHADRMAQQAAPAELKIVYFSNGQSDLGIGPITYQRACMMLANYFLRRGWQVVLGNTIFSPASSGSTQTNYQSQMDGVDAAVAALSSFYPGKCYRGANLHNVLGRVGEMGGQRCTGSVSGTTLTVSGVQAKSGSGIAVGQNVWNGTALVGVVAAMGTGTGGTGSYTLDRTASVAGGTALICAGSGLQFDGIHQNGSMVDAGGAAIADSLKAFLPRRIAS